MDGIVIEVEFLEWGETRDLWWNRLQAILTEVNDLQLGEYIDTCSF